MAEENKKNRQSEAMQEAIKQHIKEREESEKGRNAVQGMNVLKEVRPGTNKTSY